MQADLSRNLVDMVLSYSLLLCMRSAYDASMTRIREVTLPIGMSSQVTNSGEDISIALYTSSSFPP